jgi:hypothetical protein
MISTGINASGETVAYRDGNWCRWTRVSSALEIEARRTEPAGTATGLGLQEPGSPARREAPVCSNALFPVGAELWLCRFALLSPGRFGLKT